MGQALAELVELSIACLQLRGVLPPFSFHPLQYRFELGDPLMKRHQSVLLFADPARAFLLDLLNPLPEAGDLSRFGLEHTHMPLLDVPAAALCLTALAFQRVLELANLFVAPFQSLSERSQLTDPLSQTSDLAVFVVRREKVLPFQLVDPSLALAQPFVEPLQF
jgi:hypothetical protein